VREQTALPIMISGGAGSPEDFVKAFSLGADAIGSGTYFAKMDSPLLQLRSRIWNSGISIRH
jgi:imidazole glycerol phosphate synthase subunit HisF